MGRVLEAAGIPSLGPSKAAAVLEGSKGFVKDLCVEAGIPTAAYRRFDAPAPAKVFADSLGYPVVIKADGLAAGKGVIIAASKAEMDKAIDFMFEGGFGVSGHAIVVEEFMEGEEASFLRPERWGERHRAGRRPGSQAASAMAMSGPNTGGMGAYSPAPVLPPPLEARGDGKLHQAHRRGLRGARGTPYMGVLYLGLMITKSGPKLVEYNARFGDPECQVLMPRLKSDLLAALLAARNGTSDATEAAMAPDDGCPDSGDGVEGLSRRH